MKALLRTAILSIALAASAGVTYADWAIGDPFKMHFPQLPDPNGWDVNVVTLNPPPPAAVADDWLCTQTGPVSDIHIWFSMQGDQPPLPAGIAFSIWSDVPANSGGTPYSQPGGLLWSGIFNPGQYTIRLDGNGAQGWLDPNAGTVLPADHFNIWQLNVQNIDTPFFQQQGVIYWLGVNFEPTWGPAGWKTSLDHFNDDAVWWNSKFGIWEELIDPLTGQSLDMAFVITPEPGSLLLLSLGMVALVTVRRRHR